MDVDDPATEAVEEIDGEKLHVSGAHHEGRPVLLEPLGHREVACDAVGILDEREHLGRDSRPLGAFERGDTVNVRGDSAHRETLVEQGL